VDREQLLTLMDLNMFEMYREIARATEHGEVVEMDGLVLCASPLGTVITNMAMVSRPVDVDSVSAATTRVFRRRNLPFSVWTRAHADARLESDLARAGWTEITATPGMVIAREDCEPPPAPAELDIRPVLDDAGRRAYARLTAEAYAVYGAPHESTEAHFARLEAVASPTTQAFLAWQDGRPVAGAILYLSHGIGGVGWVGTLPEAFGRGYGTAVTWAVVREGFARGVPLLNLQASPMGEPVYRRMGFSTPTHYRLFIARD